MPNCSVPYCLNSSGKDSRLTFHEFPHETPIFLNKWIENIGRPNWRPGVRSVVCSEHFVKDDFNRQGRLHIGSFPSKFPDAPFRKKRKIGSEHVNDNKASPVQTTKSDTSSKINVHTVKEAAQIRSHSTDGKSPKTKKECMLADISDPSTLIEQSTSKRPEVCSNLISKTGSVPQKVCTVNENAINENKEVRVEKNPSLLPPKTTGITSHSDYGFGIPKKRKILEERQPLLPDATPVPAVATSYSLVACRICGVTSGFHTNIFGPEGKKLGLAEMISKCLPVQVSESDSLPHCLCKLCIPRLKTCYELITSSEKTNAAFRGRNSELSGAKDGDPPIIHSRPVQTQYASKSDQNRRILLLEMSLTDGIPVKGMITQAIKELSLRLTPKESRETKPQGRIMFLDLRGGPEAFPEQMKKAVSMLFPSVSGEKVANGNSHQSPGSSPQKGIERVHSKPAPPNLSTQSPTVGSTPTSQRRLTTLVTSKASGSSAMQSKVAHGVVGGPNLSGATVTSGQQVSLSSSMPNVSSAAKNQNHFDQKGPVLTPITVLPKSGSTQSICITALPGILPLTALPQLIQLPANSLHKVNPKLPTPKTPAIKTAANRPIAPKVFSLEPSHTFETHPPTSLVDTTAAFDDDNFFEDSPPGTPNLPSLVPTASAVVPEGKKKQTGSEVPIIDFAKLKDKVVTKINNSGNQFKLGDKIVGIVLRSSDSKEDIHKKLQATFSNATPLKTSRVSSGKFKDTSSLLKGSMAIPVEAISTADIADGLRKMKEPLFDVPPTVDDPSSHFERRNARKLSLSFMWRKSGFLVSSYQKLFTWQMPAHCDKTEESVGPVLICRVCKVAAGSKSEVESHLQAHPDLQCTVCSKYFLTVSKVHEHMGVIHNLSSVPPESSKKKAIVSTRQNVVKRDLLRQYQCSRCERRFKLIDSLKRHATMCKDRLLAEKEVAAKKANLHACTHSQCNRSFKTVEELERHVGTHTKRTSWLCDICGLVLKSASNYRSHLGRHDELAHEYNYQCAVCRKRFKLLNRYEEHIKKHQTSQQYVCSSCGKVFRNLSNLRQHEMLHGERKLQCRYCPSRFHRRDHLRVHENSHTRSKDDGGGYKPRVKKSKSDSDEQERRPFTGPRSYTCRFCIASQQTVVKFTNMRELMKHYNEKHSEERKNIIPGSKKFTCDRCNRSFANSTLLGHHHMWHAGISQYTCQFCGAGFMVKERLRNHEMTHTNERPFKCVTCGKGFRSKNALKQHEALHKDPSEFLKCKYCDKKFSRPDNLRTHIRVHTGEKPWKCVQCQRPFRLRSECSKHVQIAHQVPVEEVRQFIDTVFNPLINEDSSSSESVIECALSGIATVQDMELLIEPEDIEASP